MFDWLTTSLPAAILGVWIYMSSIYLIALLKKNNGLVDIAWGPGFVLILWVVQSHPSSWSMSQWFLNFAVHLWAFRLAWSIGSRNIGAEEDWRYAQWRREWGKWVYIRSYLQVFMLQGFFMLVIALPIIMLNSEVTLRSDSVALLVPGTVIFLYGLIMESVADLQKQRFKRDPKNRNKFIRHGLWSISRHPNYFGEAVLWWGIWLVSINLPWVLVAIGVVSPIVITWLVRYVSGVPFSEEKYEGDQEFEAYKRKVPPFIPKQLWAGSQKQ